MSSLKGESDSCAALQVSLVSTSIPTKSPIIFSIGGLVELRGFEVGPLGLLSSQSADTAAQ